MALENNNSDGPTTTKLSPETGGPSTHHEKAPDAGSVTAAEGEGGLASVVSGAGDTSSGGVATMSKGGSTPTNVSSRRQNKLTGDLLSDGRLIIRSFESEDREEVQGICFNHFRSLCLAAVRYYIAEHFQDLLFLTVMGFFFVPLPHLILMMVLFNLYLFGKSRWEMEQYIRKDCGDIKEVAKTYMDSDASCHFWVAEVKPPKSSEAKRGHLVGCIGLVPSRENPRVAKLVRLVVDGSHRRMRIGSRLLLQLENYARDEGYDSVRIYTNTLNPSHMKFVRQHGYTIVQTIRRGLMRGDLVTWHKRLNPVSSLSGDAGEAMGDEAVVNFRIRSAAQHVMD